MSRENDLVSKRKPYYSIQENLQSYLRENKKQFAIPLAYSDLLNAHEQIPIYDAQEEDTLWRMMLYPSYEVDRIHNSLKEIYAQLKMDGDTTFVAHLYIDRIDYCLFGNSKPFRIKIVNQFNDNHDYFYIKTADSSRIFGLELEDLLSPNRLNFIVDENAKTLVEEHIIGIPGDMFIEEYLHKPTINRVRLAKEFVKFNERCFIRLLGDMRSYNYVVDITPDFDQEQYRVRAIDFDQQCYEGKRNIYRPQFFKENNPIVEFVIENFNGETMVQYQSEERVLMAKRYLSEKEQVNTVINCMKTSPFEPSKLQQLKKELGEFHKTTAFQANQNMGDILETQIKIMLN